MKIKTPELTGAQLDWSVAIASGVDSKDLLIISEVCTIKHRYLPMTFSFQPSADWSQGGPIIEREHITIDWNTGNIDDPDFDPEPWMAVICTHEPIWYGQTPLIAAMRAYVASKLGDEVEVPEV